MGPVESSTTFDNRSASVATMDRPTAAVNRLFYEARPTYTSHPVWKALLGFLLGILMGFGLAIAIAMVWTGANSPGIVIYPVCVGLNIAGAFSYCSTRYFLASLFFGGGLGLLGLGALLSLFWGFHGC